LVDSRDKSVFLIPQAPNSQQHTFMIQNILNIIIYVLLRLDFCFTVRMSCIVMISFNIISEYKINLSEFLRFKQ